MAKNRKKHTAALRFGPALKVVVLCSLIAGSGVGYVWQRSQIDKLGEQIRQRELRLAGLAEQNDNYRNQLANLRAPRRLEEMVKALGLGLVPSEPAQVVRLAEPVRMENAGKSGQYVAAPAPR
jgi:hypothetical protein